MNNPGRLSRANGFLTSFFIFEVHNLNAPKPLIYMAALRAVYIFCMTIISYNTTKTSEPLSIWIVKTEKNIQISQIIFGNRLSILNLRHDTFNMSNRANIRQPGKPATERHSLEAKGELYECISQEFYRQLRSRQV